MKRRISIDTRKIYILGIVLYAKEWYNNSNGFCAKKNMCHHAKAMIPEGFCKAVTNMPKRRIRIKSRKDVEKWIS